MSAWQGWRAFFDGHAPFYMQNVFTRNTMDEVELLHSELRLEPGAVVPDLGCGAGRHSVEWDSEDGLHQAIVREHGYRPEGLRSLFEAAGFTLQHLGGGTAGDWEYRPVDPDGYEIMLIATRFKRES